MAASFVFEDDRRPSLTAEIAVTPLHQRHKRRIQVDPLIGEPILEAWRAVLVAPPLKDPVGDQLTCRDGTRGGSRLATPAALAVSRRGNVG
jgi:hypothetical protein